MTQPRLQAASGVSRAGTGKGWLRLPGKSCFCQGSRPRLSGRDQRAPALGPPRRQHHRVLSGTESPPCCRQGWGAARHRAAAGPEPSSPRHPGPPAGLRRARPAAGRLPPLLPPALRARGRGAQSATGAQRGLLKHRAFGSPGGAASGGAAAGGRPEHPAALVPLLPRWERLGESSWVPRRWGGRNSSY